jgi:hypothetical protein
MASSTPLPTQPDVQAARMPGLPACQKRRRGKSSKDKDKKKKREKKKEKS